MKIGITKEECKKGRRVYYYSYYDLATGEHSEPKESIIVDGEIYLISGIPCCFIKNVSGVVALSHLELINN
ncbi:hypothetical protein ETU08_00180 [Apibacter muscae]|uniref:hypothetical protein n=1 Tax=Apibacter muscae TaxID=2509004 RepID=UPI0011ADCA91|nr:hypothetical protein [Apibacter muscae]TWP31911.1 hypothetical protein ETU08_00180 [Apibacter muscae]